jgi:hypothetical protein
MINLQEEDWFIPGVKAAKLNLGETAKQIAIVIDGEVAMFLGVKEEIVNKLLNATGFLECEQIGELFCTTLSTGSETDQILSNEMTQAALLSSPQFILVDKDVQRHAEKAEVGWLYVDGQFIIPGVYV